MALPRVAVAALGGTICMAPDVQSDGVMPKLSAQQLLDAIPNLGAVAQLEAQTLRQLPSPSLSFDDLLEVLRWADEQVAQGAAGVVVTQGTDTLEESAFLLDLYWPHPQPLVLTGAMRAAEAVSADGPANLRAAVTVAADAGSRTRGVLAVMNDTIHAARWVQKTHALAVDAFTSPVAGPAGAMVEGSPHYFHPPGQRTTLAQPRDAGMRVALLESCLGDDGELLDLAVKAGYQGSVIAAFGVGHVSFAMAKRIGTLAPAYPVVIASRTGAGSTTERTYGFEGSEIDLRRRGAILAGWLGPRKARLLLWALLAAGSATEEIRKAFASFGRMRNL
ncbi:asparaginase [Paraburkholderia sp. RL17-347-BIC-D]|uniref:asparaginase n=1 Tax=Paraburkholderia sp. RL17-347-BIC-D TaxID=3031632 RepID=UPI0038B8CC8B